MKFKVVEITVSGSGMTPATGNVTPKTNAGDIDKFPFGGKPIKRRKKPKIKKGDKMKINKEDIKKYATDGEIKLLEEFYDEVPGEEDEGLGDFYSKEEDYEEEDSPVDLKGEIIQKLIRLGIISELGDYERAERAKESMYEQFADSMDSNEIDAEFEKSLEYAKNLKILMGDDLFLTAFEKNKEEDFEGPVI